MTRNPALRNLAAAATMTMAASLAMLFNTGAASAKNVLKCDGSDRFSVVECCETIVMKKGLPLWMKQTGRNCESIVKCSARANGGSDNKRRCWAYNPSITFDTSEDKKHHQPKQRDVKSNDVR